MQNWKKALIFGSVGVGAVLFFTGRRSVGTAVAAGGLAILASEYPEKFEAIWECLCDRRLPARLRPRGKTWTNQKTALYRSDDSGATIS